MEKNLSNKQTAEDGGKIFMNANNHTPVLHEVFRDNGEHDHWELIDSTNGKILWTESQPSSSLLEVIDEMEKSLTVIVDEEDKMWGEGFDEAIKTYLPKLKAIQLPLETDGESFPMDAIVFSVWKDQLFKKSYKGNNGKEYVLKNYEDVSLINGVLYGEHYDIYDLYSFYRKQPSDVEGLPKPSTRTNKTKR